MKVNPVQRPELPGKAASSRHEEVSPVQGLLEVAFQEAGLHRCLVQTIRVLSMSRENLTAANIGEVVGVD